MSVYGATYGPLYPGGAPDVSTPLIFPQIIVEAALVPARPVAGAGTFLLDDAAFGLLDTDFLGSGDTWTDISVFALSFTITRPSSRSQGPLLVFQAGTCSIVLDNSDGRFDPDNLAGPYVAAGISQVHSMVPVRIRAVFAGVSYPLFSGFADGWLETPVTYSAGYSEWTLSATDAFKVLSGIRLPDPGSPVGAGVTTGARIADLLNRAGWYTGTGRRVIAAGDSTVQATSLGDTVLNLAQLTADSEIGQLYVSGAGAVVFRNRRSLITDTRSATVQAFFGDNPAGAEMPCASIGRADDDTTIANDVQATNATIGVLQEVSDAASIAAYLFPRTYARSDLILTTDLNALSWASWVLYISKTGEDRFDSVSVDPQAQPLDLWPQVLGRDMGDRINATRRPPGVASPVSRDCFVSGITHTADLGASTWMTKWTLQDASKYGSFLTLDNATLGQLGSNALAY